MEKNEVTVSLELRNAATIINIVSLRDGRSIDTIEAEPVVGDMDARIETQRKLLAKGVLRAAEGNVVILPVGYCNSLIKKDLVKAELVTAPRKEHEKFFRDPKHAIIVNMLTAVKTETDEQGNVVSKKTRAPKKEDYTPTNQTTGAVAERKGKKTAAQIVRELIVEMENGGASIAEIIAAIHKTVWNNDPRRANLAKVYYRENRKKVVGQLTREAK